MCCNYFKLFKINVGFHQLAFHPSVLTRIKVSFLNTIVRLEHLPREAKSGAALEIRVDR